MKEKSLKKKKKPCWTGGCGTTSKWEGNTWPQPALLSHGCGGSKSAVSLVRPGFCSLPAAHQSLRGTVQPLGLEEGLQASPERPRTAAGEGLASSPRGLRGQRSLSGQGPSLEPHDGRPPKCGTRTPEAPSPSPCSQPPRAVPAQCSMVRQEGPRPQVCDPEHL